MSVDFFPFQRDWMGVGKPVGGPLFVCHGLIIKRGFLLDAAQLIRGCDLRKWKLDHLLAGQEPFRRFHHVFRQSPIIDLSNGYDAYVKDRRRAGSAQITKTLQKRRKLEREFGALRFEFHSADRAILNSLTRWKSKQYKQSGRVDHFSFSRVVDIVKKIHSIQGGSFAGVLSVLYAADQPIAVHMGMRSKTVWHYWFAAYDPAFAKYSPGMVLLLEMAKCASSLGIRTIDMGKGAEPYKQRVKNGAIPIAEGVVAVSPSLTAVRSLRRAVSAWLHRGPLDGLAKKAGKIVSRAETRWRFK